MTCATNHTTNIKNLVNGEVRQVLSGNAAKLPALEPARRHGLSPKENLWCCDFESCCQLHALISKQTRSVIVLKLYCLLFGVHSHDLSGKPLKTVSDYQGLSVKPLKTVSDYQGNLLPGNAWFYLIWLMKSIHTGNSLTMHVKHDLPLPCTTNHKPIVAKECELTLQKT